MKIPDSISSLVYLFKDKNYWTILIWFLAFVGLYLMISFNNDYAFIAFLSCACLGFVGSFPLGEDETNLLHNVLGIVSCVLSLIWVIFTGNWIYLLIYWIIYLGILYLLKIFKHLDKWCLIAEIWCIVSILATIFF